MAQHSGSNGSPSDMNADLGLFDEIRLAFRLYRDPRVSSLLKSLVPTLAALYVLSPIDLIPDLLLGIGQVDDLGVLGMASLAAIKLIRRLAPSGVVYEHLAAMHRSGPMPGSSASGEYDDAFETTYTVGQSAKRQRSAERGRGAI